VNGFVMTTMGMSWLEPVGFIPVVPLVRRAEISIFRQLCRNDPASRLLGGVVRHDPSERRQTRAEAIVLSGAMLKGSTSTFWNNGQWSG
jgi:hypothetical protein